jgi:rubrerythrin
MVAMHTMTDKNLHDAFAGESMAYMKYLIYSEKAETEGKPQLARLFKAIAAAEKVHATNHWRTLGLLKASVDNVQSCIEGETYEILEMYPAFKAVAELQEEKGAIRSTYWALETEKIHKPMYEKAKEALLAGKDAEAGDIYICPVCGYTMEGEPPEICPICNAKKGTFKRF